MKKQWFTMIIIASILAILYCCTDGRHTSNEKGNTLYWIPEESYFESYEIVNNTISFHYSICFVNNTPYDTTISLRAKFKQQDIKGWLKQEDYYPGCDKNGERLYQTIKAGEKVNISYQFTGEYLGGTVNENLSFPQKLIILER